MTFKIIQYDSVVSTMDIARELIREGGDNNIVVHALEQKGGRGRRGNQWSSPPGNLYQSIILKPQTPRQHWGQLSFVIAVALGQLCINTGADKNNIHLKWPNDVLFNERKLAGILIEIEGNSVIIGTGVNIKIAPEGRSKFHEWCTKSVEDLRDSFLTNIADIYEQWEKEGFDNIRAQWMRYAYRLGQEVEARTPQAVYKGIFENLDDQGTLILKEESGLTRNINAGEIIACS